jgi:hypothetical protein
VDLAHLDKPDPATPANTKPYLENLAGIYPKYMVHHWACDNATAAADKKRQTCHGVQVQFESDFCTWRERLEEECSKYSSRYAELFRNHSEKVAGVEALESKLQTEYTGMKKLECYMMVWMSDNNTATMNRTALEACKGSNVSMSTMHVTYPAVPNQSVCNTTPVQNYPGTTAFQITEYADLQGVAQAVTPCPPQSQATTAAPETSTAPQASSAAPVTTTAPQASTAAPETTTAPQVCARPSNLGCTDPDEVYTSLDCDGDGLLDHKCTTTTDSCMWLVLSSEGYPPSWGLQRKQSECQASSAAPVTTTAPQASTAAPETTTAPQASTAAPETTSAPQATQLGCTGTFVDNVGQKWTDQTAVEVSSGLYVFYNTQSHAQWVKMSGVNGQGVFQEAKYFASSVCATVNDQCVAENWASADPGGYSVENVVCQASTAALETTTAPQACARPSTPGCTHLDEVYTSLDCDGDGVLDHKCTTTTDSRMWLVLSSEGCPPSWGGTRKQSECQA